MDAGWCGGDFDSDGFNDVTDFNIWNSNNFGTRQIPPSLATIPTPSISDDKNESTALRNLNVDYLFAQE